MDMTGSSQTQVHVPGGTVSHSRRPQSQ